MSLLLTLVLFAGAGSAQATERLTSAEIHSQARFVGETFEQAHRRFLSRLESRRVVFPDGSAEDAAVPLSQLDFTLAPSWDSLGDFSAVVQAFDQVRDLRFMTTKDHPGFERRISWLYPDDGCFARSDLAVVKLAALHYPSPAKLFVFGELGVKTPNAPGGSVGWWYHVVPVVAYHGETYVLDQAVEPKRPLLFSEWIALIADTPVQVTASICASGAYAPESSCNDSKPSDGSDALGDERGYLKDEWKRQTRLKRDPTLVLGDSPPWGTE